jgi:integrase
MPNINDRFIKSLKKPKSKHQIYWDDKLIGFGIRITNNDARSFVLRYVIGGRERKYTVGKYPDLSSGAAREMAIELKGEIVKGGDPLDDRKKSSEIPTIKELGAEYLETKRKSLRPRTLSDYEFILRKHIIPNFGNYKTNTITQKDIQKFMNDLSDRPYAANRALQLFSAMLLMAKDQGWIDSEPAKDITKFQEDERHRYLSDAEITKLLKVLDDEKTNPNSKIIRLIFTTGSRKSEVLAARWKDFDLEKGVWFKKAADIKQKKISYIPLNSEALAVVKELKRNIVSAKKLEDSKELIVSNEEYLFYNPETKTHVKDLKAFWKKLCINAGIKNARIHDLRHTFASILVNKGVSLQVAGKLLGHSDTRTTERYSHLINSTLKQATDIFGDKIGNM